MVEACTLKRVLAPAKLGKFCATNFTSEQIEAVFDAVVQAETLHGKPVTRNQVMVLNGGFPFT